MLSVAEALQRVLEATPQSEVAKLPLHRTLGMTLAEPIVSDVDSPPHDKSLVDGYAVIAADAAQAMTAGRRLEVLEEVVCGALPTCTVRPGTAIRIMTGAPLPASADAVVMVEQTEFHPALAPRNASLGDVELRGTRLAAGQNIMRRAQSLERGATVLLPGHSIRPAEIGLLAEVGRPTVAVYRRPTVAVLSTGNELVPADSIPTAGHIRNSNGPMVCALVEQAGGESLDLGIAIDERASLERKVRAGLESDVLILSGGVSAGVLDLVPAVLADCGVRPEFHKIHLRPGKPLWFGVLDRASGTPRRTLVFGLPGNPVSVLVCFELFVRPALRKLLGQTNPLPAYEPGILAAPFTSRGDRPTYHPGAFELNDPTSPASPRRVRPLVWHGSADLRTLTAATILICFAPGDRSYVPGDAVNWLGL